MTVRSVRRAAAKAGSRGPSLWFLAPALAFFLVFAIGPLIGVVYLSFTTWSGLGSPELTGFDSWQTALGDPQTVHALRRTILLTVMTWLFQTPVSLLLGVFMAGPQRYRAVLSAIYFLPLLFSSVAVGITFKALVDPNFGLGAALNLPLLEQNWLGDGTLAFALILFVISWCFIPLHSLLYQGGARQIPQQLYEAAVLDGAGPVRQFFTITLPQLKYTIVTSSTLMIVGSLTYFDLIYVMTPNGGPSQSTLILPLYMYLLGFKSMDKGVAAVIGVILVALGLTISVVLNKFSGAEKMESQMEGV